MFAKFPLDNISIASVQTKPASVPDIAFNDADSPSPQQNLPEEEQRLARRAYYASTAGMDEQVGRLLQAMKDKGLENSTVVILHGDHGWQLGERAEWRKFNNFEITTRVPLIIKPPAWFMVSDFLGASKGERGRTRERCGYTNLHTLTLIRVSFDHTHTHEE